MAHQYIFLCGAHDFHAIDWYRSSLLVVNKPKPYLLTDLITADGFDRLISEDDRVEKLFVLDQFLPKTQGLLSNLLRRSLKLIFFPVQVLCIRRKLRQEMHYVVHAHSMYYIWLAWAARCAYVATPQGSDILIKSQKSRVYRALTKRSLKKALLITVDSAAMAEGVRELVGISPLLLQNGIDIAALHSVLGNESATEECKTDIVSIRAFTDLYRIAEIFEARNRAKKYGQIPVQLVYPFYAQEYKDSASKLMSLADQDHGRLGRLDLYKKLAGALLCISIPSSDSSPRTVYEAIFCGAAVAIAPARFYDDLPASMKSRIIIVDITNPEWFDEAVEQAIKISNVAFLPCSIALAKFDQLESFKTLHKVLSRRIGSPPVPPKT